MAYYNVKYTDNTKDPIRVNDSDFNSETSISIPGRNQRGYGPVIAENFLHLLENFANTTAPAKPIEGQIWYDTTEGVQELKVYDGTQWKSSGSLKKTASTPSSAITGDLWVDTDNQQLFLFNGATWVLVGPTFSSGLRTGLVAETVIDVNDLDRVILKTYVQDQVVSIYSADSFIPKSAISGFTEIKSGQNLSSSITLDSITYNPKVYGVAEKAENLLVEGTVVSAASFLRKDKANITNAALTVKVDQGISTGSEGQLRLLVDSNATGNIYHSTPDSQFDIRINYRGEVTTLFRASSNGNIGIGINKLDPSYTLDVDGTSRFTDILKIDSTYDTTDSPGASIQIAGGAKINKSLNVTGQTLIRKGLRIGSYVSEISNEVYSDNVITPLANGIFDIGTSDLKFRNIYANKFYGDLEGNITGNISGTSNIANRLTSGTTFKIKGDVETEEDITFDGSTGGNLKEFVTTISSTFIDNKPEFTDVNGSDEFLVFRSNTGVLGKMYRSTLFQQISTIPVGTILPFAGEIIPLGYLLCDGSEKARASYPELFAIIGYTYGDPAFLTGDVTFRLPDLRGRFPIGRNTMDNADSIETITGLVDSNTQAINPASQATESNAGILGNSSGNPSKTLTVDNIPEHQHSLTDESSPANDYFTIANRGGSPESPNASVENGLQIDTASQVYDRTNGIYGRANTFATSPINIMNPYLTINYIIYTGKFT